LGLPKGTPFGYPKGTPCGLLKGASGKALGDWKIINLSKSDSCYAKLLLFRLWKGTAFWAPVSRRPGKAIFL
jgi:hypothetical protein